MPARKNSIPWASIARQTGAAPDGISTWPIEDFLGYGLLLCHSDLREDSFSLHEVMGPGTVTALRERFLDLVEDSILYIYEGICGCPLQRIRFGSIRFR